MKIYSILLSLMVILGALPLSFASGIAENVAVVVSTPADAIVAAPYAKAMGYKLIYTPTGELSDDAKRELERNNIDKVIIVGGSVAVSTNVENQIKGLKITTQRVWGETRIETSQKMYELIKAEKPELLDNLVVVEGFNEKISPVAVSFGAPVLYYGLGKDEGLAKILETAKPKNAIIIGSGAPRIIENTLSKNAENTIIASGSDDSAVRTALAYVTKINPNAENKDVAVVYAEKTNNPILDAVVSFVSGYVGSIAPIPKSDEGIISNIVSKLTFSSGISISSDDTSLSNIVSNIATTHGLSSTGITSSGGGGGTSSTSTPTPTTKPAIKVIANGTTVEFEGQDSNTLSITGTKTINIPTITADATVVDKKDTTKNVEICFKDNESFESVIEAMNNFNKVSYDGDTITITYNNADMNGKNVSLNIITTRDTFRDNINALVDGDATGLINSLNTGYINTATVSSGKAEFTINADDSKADYFVIITEGNGVKTTDDDVKILAIGGFEVMKYNLTLTFNRTDVNNQSFYNMSLNDTPTNDVRYGLARIDKTVGIKLNVVGTNPNNNLFNVSVVGNSGSEIIVENNDFITLSAKKIQDISGTIFNSAASVSYSDEITKENKDTLKVKNISNAYVIGVVYDTVDKKIVAVEQQ